MELVALVTFGIIRSYYYSSNLGKRMICIFNNLRFVCFFVFLVYFGDVWRYLVVFAVLSSFCRALYTINQQHESSLSITSI